MTSDLLNLPLCFKLFSFHRGHNLLISLCVSICTFSFWDVTQTLAPCSTCIDLIPSEYKASIANTYTDTFRQCQCHPQLANSGHILMTTKSLWCKLSAIINIYPTTLVSFQYQGWYRYHRYLALPTYLYQTLYDNIHLSWWKPAGWTAQHVYYIHCNWSCQRMIILYLFAYLKHRGMHHNLKMPTALIHCG